MLNLFAATSHIDYAKNSRLYLQLMQELPNFMATSLNKGLTLFEELIDTGLDCGLIL